MTLRSILAVLTFLAVVGLYFKTGPEWKTWVSNKASFTMPWSKPEPKPLD